MRTSNQNEIDQLLSKDVSCSPSNPEKGPRCVACGNPMEGHGYWDACRNVAQVTIWRCKVSDGIIRYFESEFEARFFANDTLKAGFSVSTSPIPMPTTPREAVAFMEGQFEAARQLILAARNLATGENP